MGGAQVHWVLQHSINTVVTKINLFKDPLIPIKRASVLLSQKKEVGAFCMTSTFNQIFFSDSFKKQKLPLIIIFIGNFGLIGWFLSPFWRWLDILNHVATLTRTFGNDFLFVWDVLGWSQCICGHISIKTGKIFCQWDNISF